MKLGKITTLLLCLLLVNSGYLAAYATPSLFYMSNVLLHVALGAALLVLLLVTNRSLLAVFLPAGALGIFLAVAGATRPHQWALQAHIAAAVLAAVFVAGALRRRAFSGLLVAAIVFPAAVHFYRHHHQRDPRDRIVNPLLVPASMEEEANGPRGPFFPSSANTRSGGYIPSNFFMESETCRRCHPDIYDQWNSSVHHFASFNNQFYRKSVEYMQETAGVKSSKWCAGCHDHALFFNGMFETPIKDRVHTPEAQAGLGCMSCHAIVHVKDTLGNGGFTIEYPPLHDLANSKNRVLRALHDFLIYADPEPHRRTFLKPFMRLDSPEFCSTCHKVHLDVPVNSYRWIRGFNEYDNWQASGVSGQGARSFYYPAKPQTCVDCHMPLVPSRDVGNHDGQVHSHRFPAANTAVPFANQDAEQLRATEQFLKDRQISADIFGIARYAPAAREKPGQVQRPAPTAADVGADLRVRPRQAGMPAPQQEAPRAATTFAVGEEAEAAVRAAGPPQPEAVGPINVARPVVRRGEEVRVDVVVRTRKVGHFFPGGTVDAFDVWTELQATDDRGRVLFWSGALEDGNGPVEKGAHFYRSMLLDANGNPINKRNAFHARSALYVRLIPPGAADTVRFRMKIPRDAGDRIRLRARVNYRKFSWFYTNFAYAGVSQAAANGNPFSPHHDDRPVLFTGDLSGVSGKLRRIPDLPVVTMAEATAEMEVADAGARVPEWKSVARKEDRERWNDYGIGLLLQGDLKAAVTAFRRVTEAEPGYADGWLNVARAHLQEGNTEEARPWLEHALALQPNLARTNFFLALVKKAQGDYDGALSALQRAAAQYPRDRVVLNQMGRILFLQRKYQEAVRALERVLLVDPEDLMAHYTLMLCHRGLGDAERAAREEKLYLRFKADEASQTITGDYRRLNPEDNIERQPIHEHAGVADPARYAAPAAPRAARP